MHGAAGRVGDIRQGPPQADARHSPLAFRILTLPFEAEDVRDTLKRITADPVNGRWAAMMSDILVAEVDPETGFVPALPEMFYFDR